MRTAKRITTACLTAIMIFQALAPSTEVFAQELDAVMDSMMDAVKAMKNAVADADIDAEEEEAAEAASSPCEPSNNK